MMGAMIGVALEEWSLRQLDGLADRLRRPSALPPHLQTGLRGEREALFFLRRTGFTIVARRWSSARVRGDLDLIAWQRDTLCFLEVKTRTSRDHLPAEAAVDYDKREQLRKLARAYLRGFDERLRNTIPTRFDVVSVYLLASGVVCERSEDAFAWHEPNRTRPFGV